jgi:AraC-like DNA-binding protein
VCSIFDLRRDPIALVKSSCHSLHFHIPHKALEHIADEAGVPRITDLPAQPGIGIDDPIARHLLLSLMPGLSKPEDAFSVFVDHVALALVTHVARAYGGMRNIPNVPRGGLAPYQERRAKELLRANLNGEISLERLAAECGLSVRHFARAFRTSTGVPPHRWLMQQRVEQAKALLHDSAMPLSDVALACGFADQSHFTRVFTAMVGASPGAWRRMR